MIQKILVDVYSGEGNFAVIKLPSRSAPGVVFQIDSLNRLASDLQEALELLLAGSVSEGIEELEAVTLELAEVRKAANELLGQ